MTINRIFLLCVSISFTLNSCKDNPIAPPLPADPRDFVWTVDTLDMPMNAIYSIWGSSPNDVWATGPGGAPGDGLLHYDGKQWITWFRHHPQAWQVAGAALYGFAANDIWMGGQATSDVGAGIWHWDGTKWGQYFNYNPEPGTYGFGGITNIWGSQPNDVYACGSVSHSRNLVPQTTSSRGIVLHYDGATWKEVVKGDSGHQYGFLKIRGEQSNVYVQEERIDQQVGDSIIFYQLNGRQLNRIYPNAVNNPTWGNFGVITGKLIFWMGHDVYSYEGGAFVKQFSIDNPNFNQYLYGRSMKDIFIYMIDGLAHFNGTDIRYLYTWQLGKGTQNLNDAASFDNEVFICLFQGSPTMNMVLHGKLKQ
ncbi:MAG: hypothetical protein Q8N98_00055 [bacterium]|nr:hypothetical protein [bacterium]